MCCWTCTGWGEALGGLASAGGAPCADPRRMASENIRGEGSRHSVKRDHEGCRAARASEDPPPGSSPILFPLEGGCD